MTTGQELFVEMVRAKHKRDDQSAEIERLRGRLAQIVIICDDNATVGNTALALKFVREIAATKDSN